MLRCGKPRYANLVLASGAALSAIVCLSNSASLRANAKDPKNVAVQPSFVELADQVTKAPLIIVGTIGNQKRLKSTGSTLSAAGYERMLFTADVHSLIRGEGGILQTVRYLADVKVDARGRPPKLQNVNVILFAKPTSRPDYIQLLSKGSQIVADHDTEVRVRAIVNDDAPEIAGVGDAFHTSGTISGEGETQIFLRTSNGAPISLSIIRRPGQAPRWGVALGEVVDETAVPPIRNTLLWYRLACSLPPQLPAQSTRTLSWQDADAARQDYQFALQGLGTCERSL